MLRFLVPSLFWTLLVILLSLAPAQSIPEVSFKFKGFDKLVHGVMYCGLTFLWITGFKRQYKSKKIREKAFTIVLSGAFVLGIIMEGMQHFFIKNRYFEELDLIANGIGCIFGLLFFRLVYNSSYK